MTQYFIIPGLGNSEPEHWQTYFERSGDNFQRINQTEWEQPACHDWIATIQRTLSDCDPPNVVLIGHSLGCTTIAHWAAAYNTIIKGAMLVAPSDTEAPSYTFPTIGFDSVPTAPILFPTVVVASTTDQYVTLARAAAFAKNWGSRFVNIGDAGHINVASGHGTWDQGLEILRTLG